MVAVHCEENGKSDCKLMLTIYKHLNYSIDFERLFICSTHVEEKPFFPIRNYRKMAF